MAIRPLASRDIAEVFFSVGPDQAPRTRGNTRRGGRYGCKLTRLNADPIIPTPGSDFPLRDLSVVQFMPRLTEQQVREQLKDVHKPYVKYILKIANLYVATYPENKSIIRIICLPSASSAAEDHLARLPRAEVQKRTPEVFRDAFIEQCADNDMSLPEGLGAVPLPRPPAPAINFDDFGPDLRRIRRLRTETTAENGRRLAREAEKMEGWFHWVNSGPLEPGLERHWGIPYGPKTFWHDKKTHELKRNHFAHWLVRNHYLGPNSFMNCWEAVLFAAFRAHLVDKRWLRNIHDKAARAYERLGNKDHYYQELSRAFNFDASIRFKYYAIPFEPEPELHARKNRGDILFLRPNPRAELVPQVGDILFWGRDEHVAISLGRSWAKGHQPDDTMMSLWKHNGGRFAKLSLGDLSPEMRTETRFVPCPF